MYRSKLFRKITSAALLLGMLLADTQAVPEARAAEEKAAVIPVEADGTVEADDSYDGPQIKKIRVLKEENFLEIYWDRYVDENEAVDVDNFVLKNGDTRLTLEPAWTDEGVTNTLYFDRANKEIAQTEQWMTMARLDSDLHMSSICFYGEIDEAKGLTLEVLGTDIRDEDGKSARSASYTGVPYVNFYTQFLTTDTGILIKADDTVAGTSLEKAKEQVDVMLSRTDTGIAQNMEDYQCSLAVYSPHENVYMIPEHRYWFDKTMYNVEGYGGNLYNSCVSSIAEQNIVRTRNLSEDWYANTMYENENILIHEFGHCVKSVGMDLLEDKSLSTEFLAAYNHAKDSGLWPKTYCISNEDEFFATMCAIWFNVMEESQDWSDGVRGPVNTREELRQYDSQTYTFFEKIFPDQGLPDPWDETAPDRYHDPAYQEPESEPQQPKVVTAVFGDVKPTEPAKSDWPVSEIQYVYDRGIMTGLDEKNGVFGRDGQLSRAQFATVLYRMADKTGGGNEPQPEGKIKVFPDVDYNDSSCFYSDAVQWAGSSGVGIITGYEDTGMFNPSGWIERQDAVVMMYRYAEWKGYVEKDAAVTEQYKTYPDADQVAPYAERAMAWAVDNRLITGDGGRLNPKSFISRAVCATIIQRFMSVSGAE